MTIHSQEITVPFVNGGQPFTMYYEIDRFINEVLIGKEYEPLLVGMNIFDRNDLTVVDLGCNIGTFSMYIYDKAKVIHAVDFAPNCISLLRQTKEQNKFDKIQLHQTAISGDNRIIHVSSLESTDGGNSIYGQQDEIPTKTLATFMKEQGLETIDLLKMDVEGAENEILMAPDFLPLRSKIRVIIGEYHDGSIQGVLKSLGYNYILHERHFLALYENRATD